MDKDMDVKLFCKYPHLKFIKEKNVYEGYIHTLMDRYDVMINIDKNSETIYLDKISNNRLNEEKMRVVQSLNKNLKNLFVFLEELQTILSSWDNDEKETNYDTTHDLTILKEYMELRKFFVNIYKANLSGDLKHIQITTIDEGKRLHYLHIDTNKEMSDGKKLFCMVKNDVPKFIDHATFETDDSLINLYDKYKAIIDDESYQDYLNILTDIDRNCWVLEPHDKKLNYRRIALEENVSVTITFNSLSITEVPQLRFFGQADRIIHYEQMTETNCLEWNTEGTFLEKLTKLFGIASFPQSNHDGNVSGGKDVILVDDGECAICFTSELNDKIPDIVCPYMNCNCTYHSICLYEWFVTLNPVVGVNEISGKCPNCDKIITCPI